MSLMVGSAPLDDVGPDVPLVELRDLKVHFPVRKGFILEKTVAQVKAVDGVSLAIPRGQTMGLVGESGCGKTTIGRAILQLQPPTEGSILFEGRDITNLHPRERMLFRRRVQAVFQDPYSSLNPRMTVGQIIAEPFIAHDLFPNGIDRAARIRELLELCGLAANFVSRYPHEMSGGQRQRVGIARALALNPDFIVCDEAVSALDVSIQAQIIRLLEDLRAELGLTYLFIGHDLSVVRHLCQRVAVMYLGKLVEIASSDTLFSSPKHPYTQALLAAVPVPDPEIELAREHQVLLGEVPSPMEPPLGCVFHPRCPKAVATCGFDVPPLTSVGPDHTTACTEIYP